jgi:hypothetical protein
MSMTELLHQTMSDLRNKLSTLDIGPCMPIIRITRDDADINGQVLNDWEAPAFGFGRGTKRTLTVRLLYACDQKVEGRGFTVSDMNGELIGAVAAWEATPVDRGKLPTVIRLTAIDPG